MAKLDETLKHTDSKSFDMSEMDSKNDGTKSSNQLHAKKQSDAVNNIVGGTSSPLLPSISKKTDDESDGPVIPKFLGLFINNFYIVFILIFLIFLLDIYILFFMYKRDDVQYK